MLRLSCARLWSPHACRTQNDGLRGIASLQLRRLRLLAGSPVGLCGRCRLVRASPHAYFCPCRCVSFGWVILTGQERSSLSSNTCAAHPSLAASCPWARRIRAMRPARPPSPLGASRACVDFAHVAAECRSPSRMTRAVCTRRERPTPTRCAGVAANAAEHRRSVSPEKRSVLPNVIAAFFFASSVIVQPLDDRAVSDRSSPASPNS